MITTFYIKTKGEKPLKFKTAGGIDLYLRTNRLQPTSIIQLQDENKKVIGELSVAMYIEMARKEGRIK